MKQHHTRHRQAKKEHDWVREAKDTGSPSQLWKASLHAVTSQQLGQWQCCRQAELEGEGAGAAGVAARPFSLSTYFTLVLVQMMYSISSEYGFWKVKELVRIQSHSRFLDRKRNMTDRT